MRLVLALMTLLGAATANADNPPKKFPWQKDPGPIAGRWAISCDAQKGLTIEVEAAGNKATGKIHEVGAASKYGYKKGEEILRLTADDYGDWVGTVLWRSVAGVERWDPIRFVATPDELKGTIVIEPCWRVLKHP
jgi:hypothetical protein